MILKLVIIEEICTLYFIIKLTDHIRYVVNPLNDLQDRKHVEIFVKYLSRLFLGKVRLTTRSR